MLPIDLALVMRWAVHKGRHSSSTRRAYTLAGRAFLAWLEYSKGAGAHLADVTSLDARAYMDYLGNPITPIPWEIYHQYGLARPPAARPLKQTSIFQLANVLCCLYNALPEFADQYDHTNKGINPFENLSSSQPAHPLYKRKNVLTPTQWHAIFETLSSHSGRATVRRNTLAFLLTYYTFLRNHEISKLRMSDFYQLRSGIWMIKIDNSEFGYSNIAAPSRLIDALKEYRPPKKSSSLLSNELGPALIPMRVRGNDGMTSSNVYYIFKNIFHESAERFPEFSDIFKRATPTWVRNTGIATALSSYNIAERYVRRQAGFSCKQLDNYIPDDESLANAFLHFGPPPTDRKP
nr:hypothetical protein [Burkholderia ambifaria]